MKFGNEFWLILFQEYINPKLFAVWVASIGIDWFVWRRLLKLGSIKS
jgi:hypothetical protein